MIHIQAFHYHENTYCNSSGKKELKSSVRYEVVEEVMVTVVRVICRRWWYGGVNGCVGAK